VFRVWCILVGTLASPQVKLSEKSLISAPNVRRRVELKALKVAAGMLAEDRAIDPSEVSIIFSVVGKDRDPVVE
jgi:hypothetical protein